MPGRITAALVVIWLQVLASGWIAAVQFAQVSDDADHGFTDHYGLYVTLASASLGLALLLAVCAVCAVVRRGWVRVTVIILELLSLLGGILILFAGGVFQGLLGTAVPAAVIIVFGSEEGLAWFRR